MTFQTSPEIYRCRQCTPHYSALVDRQVTVISHGLFYCLLHGLGRSQEGANLMHEGRHLGAHRSQNSQKILVFG